MPHREPCQEGRDGVAGGAGRVGRGGPAELERVADRRIGQLDSGALGAQAFAQDLAQLLQRLPQRGSGLGLGRLPPEQAGQRLATVGPRLEHQERKQRQ